MLFVCYFTVGLFCRRVWVSYVYGNGIRRTTMFVVFVGITTTAAHNKRLCVLLDVGCRCRGLVCLCAQRCVHILRCDTYLLYAHTKSDKHKYILYIWFWRTYSPYEVNVHPHKFLCTQNVIPYWACWRQHHHHYCDYHYYDFRAEFAVAKFAQQ